MSSTIRVAAVYELPPGKGKVVEVAGRSYTVFNRDGRFYATVSAHTLARPFGDTSDTCAHGGLAFDVWMEDSPARLNDEDRCAVRVDGDAVWLVLRG